MVEVIKFWRTSNLLGFVRVGTDKRKDAMRLSELAGTLIFQKGPTDTREAMQ